MFLSFFIFLFFKSETLLVLLAEAKLVALSAALSLKIHNHLVKEPVKNFHELSSSTFIYV